MKFFTAFLATFGIFGLVTLVEVSGVAQQEANPADQAPISVGEASYLDLVDEINRLMDVRSEEVEDPEDGRRVFARFEAMVRGLVKINDLETARKLADHARRLYPDQMRSAFLAGWVHGLSGDRREAVDLLLAGLGEGSDVLSDPEHQTLREIKTTLAGFLIDLGDPSEAVKHLDPLAEEEDSPALVHYLAGLAHHHLGDAYQCSRSYRKAMDLDESLAVANDYLVYAWAEDKLNRSQRAAAILDRGVERFPMEPGLFFNRAANHEVLGASREAFYDYRMEVLVGGEDSAFSQEAHVRCAKISGIQAKVPTPDKDLMNIVYYLRAREQLAQTDPARLNGGDALKKQIERTNALLDKVLEDKRNPHPFLVYLNAERRIEQERYEEAIELLSDAVDNFPGQVLFEIQLAQAYANIGETAKSDELIRSAQLAAPNHWIVRDTLGPASTGLTFEGLEDF